MLADPWPVAFLAFCQASTTNVQNTLSRLRINTNFRLDVLDSDPSLKPGFHMIATIIWWSQQSYGNHSCDRCHRCDHMETTLAIVAIVAIIWKLGLRKFGYCLVFLKTLLVNNCGIVYFHWIFCFISLVIATPRNCRKWRLSYQR